MLVGKRFKLLDSALALDGAGKRGWVSIPAGTIVEVVSGPYGNGDQLVELLWKGHLVTMFAADLAASAELEHEIASC